MTFITIGKFNPNNFHVIIWNENYMKSIDIHICKKFLMNKKFE